MPAKLNLSGQKYGRLEVIEVGANRRKWLCRCDCGNMVEVFTGDIRKGHTQSCGCLHIEGLKARLTKHGKHRSKEWNVWYSMVDRCTHAGTTSYKNYGGRGIKVCSRWMAFENFLADMGNVPDGMSIDRIDVNGDYTPENCRWATREDQSNNKRTSVKVDLFGVVLTVAQWASRLGVPKNSLYSRIRRRGMSPTEAVLESYGL